jgi:hypothetical protein
MIFGGLLDSKAVAGDTWVLDIPTLTWRRGPDSNVRRSMNACTIVNNTFISWGGKRSTRGSEKGNAQSVLAFLMGLP